MDDNYDIFRYVQSCNTHSLFDVFNKRNTDGTENLYYLGYLFDNWKESSNNITLNLTNISTEQKNIFIEYNTIMCNIGNKTVRLYKYVCGYNNTNEEATINAINLTKDEILSDLKSLNFYASMIKTKFDFDEEDFAKKLHNHCVTRFEEIIDGLKSLTIDVYRSPLKNDFKLAYKTLKETYNLEEVRLFNEIRKNKSIAEPKRTKEKPKKCFKDFFKDNVNNLIIETIQNKYKDFDGKKMACLIYLLHKDLEIIDYSLNSKTESRKHFVNALIGKDSTKIMTGINNYFDKKKFGMRIYKPDDDNDYTTIKNDIQYILNLIT